MEEFFDRQAYKNSQNRWTGIRCKSKLLFSFRPNIKAFANTYAEKNIKIQQPVNTRELYSKLIWNAMGTKQIHLFVICMELRLQQQTV